MLIMVGWIKLTEVMYPQKPAATTPSASVSDDATTQTDETAESRPAVAEATTTGDAPSTDLPQVVSAVSREPVTLGDDRPDDPTRGSENPYHMAVVVTPEGAGVATITLSDHRNQVARDRKNPGHDPYRLLSEVEDARTGQRYASFVIEELRIVEEKQTIPLADAVWSIEKTTDESGETALLETTIRTSTGPVLRLRRSFRVEKGSYHLKLNTTIENLTDQPRKVVITERGPVGIRNDDPQREFRRIVSAVVDKTGRILDGQNATRADVFKLDSRKELAPGEDRHTLWAALGSKYFACIVCPLPREGSETLNADYFVKVVGRAFFEDANATEDLGFEQVFASGEIKPGQTTEFRVEAFCGPKSNRLLDTLPEAAARGYEVAQHVDQSGTCTFRPLPSIMLWLLTTAHRVVGNYGIAIIILVIIVRTVLHPITKRGQINMMKMQKAMGALKPKLEALQQQYKNDKQKLQEETMKLYREEGVNPAGGILGCLPLFLQMPVWVALWVTLNTNVDLRHEPFFWWIRDLSSPDALIPFKTGFSIPLLGALMGPIHGLNILPILMTITMYAQQKFMQKLTRPATPATPKVDEHGNPMPDPVAQQQKMMNIMTIFFGLIFYNFPSGLNLYILSSNLLGMVEQYRIKKHIREKDERGELDVKKPRPDAAGGGKPSFLERLAKKAEEARQIQSARVQEQQQQPKKRKKQPRF